MKMNTPMDEMEITLLSYLVPTVITIGAAVAFHQSYARSVKDIQTRLSQAYKEENEMLHKQLLRSTRITAAMRYALKEMGLHIHVNGEFVSIYSERTHHRKSIQIPSSSSAHRQSEDMLEEEEEDIDNDDDES